MRLGVLSLAAAVACKARGGEAVPLTPAAGTGDLQQVKVIVEVRGHLAMNPNGKGVTRTPVEMTGELVYDEKQLAEPDGPRQRAVRFYQEAEATMRIGGTRRQARVNDDRRLVVVETTGAGAVLFSPWGHLAREELDLIDVQGARLPLSALLPNREVKPGESWPHPPQILNLLLGLEAISQSDVKSTLSKVETDAAVIEMSGSVSGAVGGVAAEIDLEAKYNFDLAQRRITWLAMSIKEKRSIGHAEPGFEVVARVRMAASGIQQSRPLEEAALDSLPLKADAGAELIRLEAARGGFRLLHDRRWRVLVDRTDVTVLRFVDRGDLIAQCNISKLPNLPAGQQLQLEAFQEEIRRALDKTFGQFIEASQTVTDRGLRVLRVVAAGIVSELPIQWTYYHICDDRGRRVSCVFTMESRLADQFAEADGALISSLEFADSADGGVGGPSDAEKPLAAGEAAKRRQPSAGTRLRR
jgi:hypothetical protein